MKVATFIDYQDGYFTFAFDEGHDMVFEEVHPKLISKYDLVNDRSFIGREFQLSFSEKYEDYDEDFVIYRIENLKLLDL